MVGDILEAQSQFFLTDEECADVLNLYGQLYEAELAVIAFQKYGSVRNVFLASKSRGRKLQLLVEALTKKGITLRSDSRLVYVYLDVPEESWPSLETTVSLIEEANFLNEHTQYRYLWLLCAGDIRQQALVMTQDDPRLSMVTLSLVCLRGCSPNKMPFSSLLSRKKLSPLSRSSSEIWSKRMHTPSWSSRSARSW